MNTLTVDCSNLLNFYFTPSSFSSPPPDPRARRETPMDQYGKGLIQPHWSIQTSHFPKKVLALEQLLGHNF